MARSLKKGPFIHYKLQRKVDAMNESGKNSVIKTWSRASMISPDFVGKTFAKTCTVTATMLWVNIYWASSGTLFFLRCSFTTTM